MRLDEIVLLAECLHAAEVTVGRLEIGVRYVCLFVRVVPWEIFG